MILRTLIIAAALSIGVAATPKARRWRTNHFTAALSGNSCASGVSISATMTIRADHSPVG